MVQQQVYSVLIVEDSFVIAYELQKKLERFGYMVLDIIATGEEAIKVALADEPDLIMMDIILAGEIDGIQTAIEIKKQKDIPILFTTGHADDAKIERAKQSKPLGYILKPYDDNRLRITLLMAIERMKLEQELKNYKNHLEELVTERTRELEKQKQELERINYETNQSIEYASNIQSALLPEKSCFSGVFDDYFIIFQPKESLSGDFFWFYDSPSVTCFAAADCTGHGIPGALLSIIGNNFLNQIVIRQNIVAPNIILNHLNKYIWDTFEKNTHKFRISDGMDIAFCTYYKSKHKIIYAGAYRPLLIVRDGKLITYGPDRQSIGGVTDYEATFTQHHVQLKENDCFYIFSDGFTDQFNPSCRQKFRTRRFGEMLVAINSQPMYIQKQTIMQRFNEWSAGHYQMDDILIMGFKI